MLPHLKHASNFNGNSKTVESHVLESNPNVRRMIIVNESGLYSAIFGSKLPSAKKFKRWVTSEVLPSIRKNNAYSVSFSDKDILLKAVDIVDVKIKEKKDELNKLEQSRSVFNILID